MRMSLLPLRACGLALACSAVLTALSLFTLAPSASAQQVSFHQVTPVGPYDAVPRLAGPQGPFGEDDRAANYVTPDGASVVFSTIGPFPGLPSTGGRLDILRATRAADGTWTTTWMSPGADTFFGTNLHDRVFQAASTDGTKVIFESRDQLDPSRLDCGTAATTFETECYLRVYEYDSSTGVTSLVSRATVQPNALFDARFASASPDLGTVTWLTPEAMTPGVEDQNSIDLYSKRTGAGELVSAQSGSTGSVSSKRVVWEGLTFPGFPNQVEEFEQPRGVVSTTEVALFQVPARNAHLVSADGSEVFFQDVRQLTAGAPGPEIENVYMRRGATTTLLSSAAQRTLPTTIAPSGSAFGDATPDGHSAFFSTASQLTDGDGNASVDVYRYDVPSGEVSLVSAFANTQAAATEGTGSYFVAASADGSHVYFASRDDLDPNSAPAGNAWKLYERVGGQSRFIAVDRALADVAEALTSVQLNGCAGESTTAVAGEETTANQFDSGGCDQVATIRATADGSRLLFESAQALTPGAATGLKCLTASPFAPNGDTALAGTGGGPLFDGLPGQGCNIYLYDDASRTVTLVSPGSATYGAFLMRHPFPNTHGGNQMTAPLGQPLLMSRDGGRVFFSSRDALLPGAVNGLANIYMWSEGSLTLVSPPNETSEAVYDDNSADGSQVFFHSRQSLIPGADNNGQFAIYDAQLGGSPAVGPSDPPSAPQPVASAPEQALTVNATTLTTPAAVSVSAAAATPAKPSTKSKQLTRAQKLSRALKACKRDTSRRDKKKRAACEAQARKKYRPTSKATKSNQRGSR
jgi:hypothetical protein